jgi:hypothetical protein
VHPTKTAVHTWPHDNCARRPPTPAQIPSGLGRWVADKPPRGGWVLGLLQPASESFDWLERRFEGGMLPARADLETAWGRIADEEELPGAFAAVKTYRVHAVPLTDLTARAIIDACMRVERPDIAVHVLNNKHLLRVWPAAPEYATVVGALLGSDRPLGDGGLSLAVTLCRGAPVQACPHPQTHCIQQGHMISRTNLWASDFVSAAA